MKKLLLSSFLSLASLALWAAASQAGAFGLIPDYCCPFHHGCCGCCNKYCCTICCRPYNAFTPICYGNMNFDGCCCGMPSCGFPSCPPPCGQGMPTCSCMPSCTGEPACPPSCGSLPDACAPPSSSPCAPPLAPSAPSAPAVLPVPAPAPSPMSMRQPAPVQTAVYRQVAPYYYAPMVPPTVVPTGYQPWYWAPGGYGR